MSRHTAAGARSRAPKYCMWTAASPACSTAAFAASTNDRSAGSRLSSEVWETNTLRGGEPDGTAPAWQQHALPGGRVEARQVAGTASARGGAPPVQELRHLAWP